MRRYRLLLVAVVIGILGSACAKATSTAEPPATSDGPAAVHVDLTDNQGTVSLNVGESLVVDLPLPPKGAGWTLLEWPKDILGSSPVLGGPARFPYTFIARQAGEGKIIAVNRTGCDGIRTAAGPACAAACGARKVRFGLLSEIH